MFSQRERALVANKFNVRTRHENESEGGLVYDEEYMFRGMTQERGRRVLVTGMSYHVPDSIIQGLFRKMDVEVDMEMIRRLPP
jgi:hypothetical protein